MFMASFLYPLRIEFVVEKEQVLNINRHQVLTYDMDSLCHQEKKRMEVNCLQNHSTQKVYHVAQRLLCLKYSNQDEDTIREALQNLKEFCLSQKL